VNRADLIDAIRDRLGADKKTAESAVNAVLDTIQRTVANGDRVTITGFGVFEKVERAARTGRNPRTGETVKVKKTAVPKFRPGSHFKGVVSGAIRMGRVADAATKSAAKSAAAGPRKAGAAARSAAGRTTAKKAPAKKATAKKATAKKAPARKTAAKKTTARKTTAQKAPARKTTAKKTAKKTTAKKSTARR
jgi:DNA-binding protein HU-beta